MGRFGYTRRVERPAGFRGFGACPVAQHVLIVWHMPFKHHFRLAQRVWHVDGRIGTITRVATAASDVVRVRWGTNDAFEFGDGDEPVNVRNLVPEEVQS